MFQYAWLFVFLFLSDASFAGGPFFPLPDVTMVLGSFILQVGLRVLHKTHGKMELKYTCAFNIISFSTHAYGEVFRKLIENMIYEHMLSGYFRTELSTGLYCLYFIYLRDRVTET